MNTAMYPWKDMVGPDVSLRISCSVLFLPSWTTYKDVPVSISLQEINTLSTRTSDTPSNHPAST